MGHAANALMISNIGNLAFVPSKILAVSSYCAPA
jgi:hypothetical protein